MDEIDDVFGGRGVEVTLSSPEDFLKVMETLTRIGVASRHEKTLYQSCHILHKRGRYAIVHFKEMMDLDGRETDTSEEDLGRRNVTARLLDQWGLVSIVHPEDVVVPTVPMSLIKVLPHRDKADWTLVAKYTVGKRR